jgi:hypothetical protein
MSVVSGTATSSRHPPGVGVQHGGIADLPGMLAAHGVVRTLLLWVGLCLMAAASGHAAKHRYLAALWPCVVLGFGSTLWQLTWKMLGKELAAVR